MSTEYKMRFDKPNAPSKMNPSVGPKEFSGFVANNEKDTLTGEPGERWMYRNRSTGVSDYKDRYLPYEFPRVSLLYINDIYKIYSKRLI